MEVTPESIRLRKQILNKNERAKAAKKKKSAEEQLERENSDLFNHRDFITLTLHICDTSKYQGDGQCCNACFRTRCPLDFVDVVCTPDFSTASRDFYHIGDAGSYLLQFKGYQSHVDSKETRKLNLLQNKKKLLLATESPIEVFICRYYCQNNVGRNLLLSG